MIICVKHIAIEGPGTLGEFFERNGFSLKTIELDQGDSLPDDLSESEAVIILGGPMNVYEEEKYPFLKQENIFIQKVIREGIPLLGICLGSQLIAKAAYADIAKASVKEIGFSTVNLTKDGQNDPLFKGFDREFNVFQWHEDTFEMPKSGKHLAMSSLCKNQAFRLGNNAYGLQFHVEVTDQIIESWIKEYLNADDTRKHPAGAEMLDQYSELKDVFNKQAEILYQNFRNIITKTKVSV